MDVNYGLNMSIFNSLFLQADDPSVFGIVQVGKCMYSLNHVTLPLRSELKVKAA